MIFFSLELVGRAPKSGQIDKAKVKTIENALKKISGVSISKVGCFTIDFRHGKEQTVYVHFRYAKKNSLDEVQRILLGFGAMNEYFDGKAEIRM